MDNTGNRSGSTYITMKQRCLKYSIKTTYILCLKNATCTIRLKKCTRILEKYLVKAIHKQIHKYIKTSKKRKLFRRISGKVWIIGFWGIPGRVGVTF